MESQVKLEALLQEYGFKQSNLSNEFTKGKSYKAVVWKSNKVTICRYTPKYVRYLNGKTYEDVQDLEIYLKENHFKI